MDLEENIDVIVILLVMIAGIVLLHLLGLG